ncbi:unnamed protein product, partial [Trypanosoma congolense IL3000]
MVRNIFNSFSCFLSLFFLRLVGMSYSLEGGGASFVDLDLGELVDSLLSNAGLCSVELCGSISSRRKKSLNAVPSVLLNDICCGRNPFFISLKDVSSSRLVELRAKEVPRRRRRVKECVRDLYKRSYSVLDSSSANNNNGIPIRVLSGGVVRRMCRGVTKAVVLFKNFKVCEGSGRRRGARHGFRKVKYSLPSTYGCEDDRSCSIDHTFWRSVAVVLNQRAVFKALFCEMWHEFEGASCGRGLPHVLRILRSFPLFGVVVEVGVAQWRCSAGRCSAEPVFFVFAMGVIIHETSNFIGVAVLGSGDIACTALADVKTLGDALEG